MIKHPKTRTDFYTKDEVAELLGMGRGEFDAYFNRHRDRMVEDRDFALFISADALPELIDAQDD